VCSQCISTCLGGFCCAESDGKHAVVCAWSPVVCEN
jgi:hypothetical protein